jgi:hypothetical protein
MSIPPFYLIWNQNGTLLRGYQGDSWVDGSLIFPINFPGKITEALQVTLQSSARANNTLETLTNVKLYLTGDPGDLAVVQGVWPYLSNSYTPARAEMNGGLEISFDGVNYTRFTNEVGLESDPSTWITLPAISIGQSGQDGILGPFDMATLTLRYNVPAAASMFKVFNIQLAADCDVV